VSDINWGRLVVGALVASVIAFATDGFLHGAIHESDWQPVYANLKAVMPQENPVHMVYFAIFELGRGFLAMFIYVLLRSHCKPGPKTAAGAGVVAWIAFSLTGPAQFIPLGFYSNALWMKVGAYQLVTSIIATIAGAALYKSRMGTDAANARV